ncbi:MAG TPA: hypothetical protein VGC56_10390 [Allosphingosinicella sp.]
MPKPAELSALFSPLLIPGLRKLGWAKEHDGKIDWLPSVSDGEYNHSYYSLRGSGGCSTA